MKNAQHVQKWLGRNLCSEGRAILYVRSARSLIYKLRSMTYYKLRDKDCKNYPHFDAPISRRILQRLVNDPAAVARHAFLPFLVYTKARNSLKSRIAGKAKKPPRPFRYAARQDAAILSLPKMHLTQLTNTTTVPYLHLISLRILRASTMRY